MSNPRNCSIADCRKVASACGLCSIHYSRLRRHGSPLVETRIANVGRVCDVDGCGRPARKRGWCDSHYAQQQRTGEPPTPFVYKWVAREPCVICGAPSAYGMRLYCSANCRRMHRTERPDSVACIACGVTIDLHERGKGGERRQRTTKFCRRCKQDYAKYKLTAAQLAERDGVTCGICGQSVDMSLRRKDSNMCASVDHILPRALGGTHEPENLQLAHLYCNQVKSDRWGLVPPAVIAGG